MLEAMACGVPVAAFPVTGPRDVIQEGICGAVDADLEAAVTGALAVDRSRVLDYAKEFTWERTATIFEENLAVRT